jgi:formate hydrogenlyase subunit 3/multisubunit Na+/H+ antiporter MnhD subunit
VIILYAAIVGHHYAIAFLCILFLALIFMGLAGIILRMAQTPKGDEGALSTPKESLSMVLPILFLILVVVMLGIHIPSALNDLLRKSAGLLGG